MAIQDFAKSAQLKATRLTRQDVIDLIRLITSGIPQLDRLEISVDTGQVRLRGKQVDEIFADSCLPDVTNNIEINAQTRQAYIAVDLHFNNGRVYVASDDEVWGLGKYDQLIRFMREKRARCWWLRQVFPATSPIAIGAIVLGVNLCQNNPLAGASFIAFGVGWFLAFWLLLREKFLPFVQIVIREKPIRLSISLVTLFVEGLSLIVGLVGLLKWW